MLTIKPIESIQIGQIQLCMIIDRETVFKKSLFEGIEKYPENSLYFRTVRLLES